MGAISVADIPARPLRAARTLFEGEAADGAPCMYTVEYMHALERCSRVGSCLHAHVHNCTCMCI